MANPSAKNIEIMDVTIRDGSYLIDFQFKFYHIERLVRFLDEAGLKYIEASQGLGLGAWRLGYKFNMSDLEYAKAAAKGRKSALLGAIGHHRYTHLEDIDEISEYIDFFRVIVGPNEASCAIKFIKHTKGLGLMSIVQLSRSPYLSADRVSDSVAMLSDSGADIIYIVDTTGCMMPHDVEEYIGLAKKRSHCRIGFHAHNMLQMAMANTLEAVKCGADIVDASLMGVGRDLGNASLEALVLNLRKIGVESGVSFEKLVSAYNYASLLFENIKRPSWYAIYLASLKRDIYPLVLIDIIAKECHKDPFEVMETLAAMDGVTECRDKELRELVHKLGGDFDQIVKKYGLKVIS